MRFLPTWAPAVFRPASGRDVRRRRRKTKVHKQMDELIGRTRRFGAGRRLLSSSLLTRGALRVGNPSLYSTTVSHMLRRASRFAAAARAQPPESEHCDEPTHGHAGGRHEAGARHGFLARGAAFAGYTILRPLGAGGMAEVYLALHPRLPRRDVIKVLAQASTADREFRERFNREADLAATLWHQNIVGVHDRGEFDGRLWISMDFVDGTDACQLVREHYPAGMPADEVCIIIQAVAGALDYAHGRGLLHRDIKPANILLTHVDAGERRIMLADFGVARHLGDISGITQTNVAVGTVAYAAPEQMMSSHIDARADQYALAATAFHLLTGAPPFQRSNPIAVISQHLHDERPRLSDYRPDLAHLDDVFFKALAKKPDSRFERCREFAAAVGAGLAAVSESDRAAQNDDAPGARLSDRNVRGVLAGLGHRYSVRIRLACALVCAVLIAVPVACSALYTVQTGAVGPKPALAATRGFPAATPGAAAKILDGVYRLDYERSNRTTNGISIRHPGVDTSWWAFHSACTASGCASTGIQLDDINHQEPRTTDGGQTDILRFISGYWQGAQQEVRVGCRLPNALGADTQQETVAWSLAPQSDGTLRGVETETVRSNECGGKGAVLRIPVVATRVGDVPAGVALGEPAQAVLAPVAKPVLGGICDDADKLAYDQTSNQQVVCEGNTWDKAPIVTAGTSCARLDISAFAMSTSDDGYLIECDPVTRMWTRHS